MFSPVSFLVVHRFFTKIIHHLQLKLKSKCGKQQLVTDKNHILLRLYNSAVMDCCLSQHITSLLSQFIICDNKDVYTFTWSGSYPFKWICFQTEAPTSIQIASQSLKNHGELKIALLKRLWRAVRRVITMKNCN